MRNPSKILPKLRVSSLSILKHANRRRNFRPITNRNVTTHLPIQCGVSNRTASKQSTKAVPRERARVSEAKPSTLPRGMSIPIIIVSPDKQLLTVLKFIHWFSRPFQQGCDSDPRYCSWERCCWIKGPVQKLHGSVGRNQNEDQSHLPTIGNYHLFWSRSPFHCH